MSKSSKKSVSSRIVITTGAKTSHEVKLGQCKHSLPSRSLHLFKPSAILIDLINIATDATMLQCNKVCIASQWDKVTFVYDDVAVTLRKWHTDGIRLYACGQTSKEITKCIFSKTTHGNISALFTDFFDENSVGSLSCSKAFRHLAASHIHCSPADIVFLGANATEVQAAKDAGYRALVVKKTAPEVAIVKKREEVPTIASVADLQLRATVPEHSPAAPVVVCDHHYHEQMSPPKVVHLKPVDTHISNEKTRKIAIRVEAVPPKSAQKPVVCCHSAQKQKPRSTRTIKIKIVPAAKSRAYSSGRKSTSDKSSKSKSSKSGSVSRRYSSKSDSSSSSSASKSKSDSSSSSGSSSLADSSSGSSSSGSSSSGSLTSGSNTSGSSNTSSTSSNSAAAPSGATLLNNLIYDNSSSQNSDSSNNRSS